MGAAQIRHAQSTYYWQNVSWTSGTLDSVLRDSNDITNVSFPQSGGLTPEFQVTFDDNWGGPPRAASNVSIKVRAGAGNIGGYGADLSVILGYAAGGSVSNTTIHLPADGVIRDYVVAVPYSTLNSQTGIFVYIGAYNRASWTPGVAAVVAELSITMEEPKFAHLILDSGHLRQVDGDTLGYLRLDPVGGGGVAAYSRWQFVASSPAISGEAIVLGADGHLNCTAYADVGRN